MQTRTGQSPHKERERVCEQGSAARLHAGHAGALILSEEVPSVRPGSVNLNSAGAQDCPAQKQAGGHAGGKDHRPRPRRSVTQPAHLGFDHRSGEKTDVGRKCQRQESGHKTRGFRQRYRPFAVAQTEQDSRCDQDHILPQAQPFPRLEHRPRGFGPRHRRLAHVGLSLLVTLGVFRGATVGCQGDAPPRYGGAVGVILLAEQPPQRRLLVGDNKQVERRHDADGIKK